MAAYTFNRASLESQRASSKEMYLMKVIDCSDPSAMQETHSKANPYIARALRKELTRFITNVPGTDETAANLDAQSLADTDFETVYRGTELGFAIISPTVILEGMKVIQPTFSVTADTGIKYRVRFAEYAGKGVMKGRKEVDPNLAFGFGEIPPTALMHPLINTEEAVKSSFHNALINGSLKPHTIEYKKDAAGNRTNELVVKWTTTMDSDRLKFYKAYKVGLPTGDEGSITFSGEFCEKFNLHKKCGRALPDRAFTERWEDPRKPHCPHCNAVNDKGKGKKKVQKRSFDDMFNSLNNE